MRSHAGVRTDLFQRDPSKVLLTDFFGGVAQAEIVTSDDIDDARDFARLMSSATPTPPQHEAKTHQKKPLVWMQMASERLGGTGWDSYGLSRAWASVLLVVGAYLVTRFLT